MSDLLTEAEFDEALSFCWNGWTESRYEIERHDAALRAALEIERLRLAACGVAALQNTESSARERIKPDNPYYSASYGDVCSAVDREMALRAALADAERERDDALAAAAIRAEEHRKERDARVKAERERDGWHAEAEAWQKTATNLQERLDQFEAYAITVSSALADRAYVEALGNDLTLTRGAMAADDNRLRDAAIRVWGEHVRGCDTPDAMADLIEHLRNEVTCVAQQVIDWSVRAGDAERERDACREIFKTGTRCIDYDRWIGCVNERDSLRARLREVASAGVEFDDQRLDYVTVQIDRETWGAVRALGTGAARNAMGGAE